MYARHTYDHSPVINGKCSAITIQEANNMETPSYSPKGFYRMIQQYKEAQLLFAAIKLDIFTYLSDYTTVSLVAAQTGYNERNLAFFLNSLASIQLLEKKNTSFRNTPQTGLYLNRNSPLYLGEYLLFWNQMTGLEQTEELVRTGPNAAVQLHNQGVRVYNFRELARLSATEMRTGRIQSFLQAAVPLFSPTAPLKLLDLGGGSGMMAIEFVSRFSGASGLIFEHPSVADVPEQFVRERQLTGRLSIMRGDFTVDSIGTGYDLIIASGILDFANANLAALMEKLARALAPSGYLYLVTHEVSDDYLSPKESIIGWLSSHLAGLDILLTKREINLALANARFKKIELQPIGGVIQNLHGEFYALS
jgi:hypothetical protein